MEKYLIPVLLIVFSIIGSSFQVNNVEFENTQPGGWTQVNINNTDVKKIASFATKTIEAKRNVGPIKLIKINKASEQIVAGKNYKLTLELATKWRTIICEVLVFYQSWTNIRILERSSCSPKTG